MPAETFHEACLNGSPPFKGLKKVKPPPKVSNTTDENLSEELLLRSSTA
tara:strand:- start:408 stop:554 length:147 start_codon:yes stop_codon:yes gene_type:complete